MGITDIGETVQLNLRQLVFNLYITHGMGGMEDFFHRYGYNVYRPFEDTTLDYVIGIHYSESSRFQKIAEWESEANGRFYWVDDNGAIPLKDSFRKSIKIDPTQMCNGYLTGKRDGQLVVISVYPPSCHQYPIMKCLVESKRVLYTEGVCGLIIPSTKDTLFIESSMWGYFITALYQTLERPLPPQSIPKPDGEFFDLKYWSKIQLVFSQWMDRQMALVSSVVSLNDMTNFTYQMICANRTTYRGTLHSNVTSYKESSITFLGLVQTNVYYPYMVLPETDVAKPICIKVDSMNDVLRIMEDMNAVTQGHMSHVDFLEFYVPDRSVDYELDPTFLFINMGAIQYNTITY